MTTANVQYDSSELDNLNVLLAAAAARVDRVRARGLATAAQNVRAAGEATARAYPKGTGALADNVTVSGTALTQVVGSDLREASFLEFGSPNTGAPRPWLTAPAHAEMTQLLKDLGEAGSP